MQEIIIAMVAAMSYAMTVYIGKKPKGEVFQPRKLIRALVIGGVLGIIAQIKGVELSTVEEYVGYSLANTGVIAMADHTIKAGYRIVMKFVFKKTIDA
ncbi:MAG: hypothetical protein KAR06_04110 [Deltaproteobacteria bacterium]|nr:hypothetical protein [Deltaproteobacteria bacterium]